MFHKRLYDISYGCCKSTKATYTEDLLQAERVLTKTKRKTNKITYLSNLQLSAQFCGGLLQSLHDLLQLSLLVSFLGLEVQRQRLVLAHLQKNNTGSQ